MSFASVSSAQPTTSQICLDRLKAEKALEALEGCPRLVELDDLRRRYNTLLGEHQTLQTEARRTDNKRTFAEGERDEARRGNDALKIENRELVATVALLRDQSARKWPWWKWAGIGALFGAAATTAILLLVPRPASTVGNT